LKKKRKNTFLSVFLPVFFGTVFILFPPSASSAAADNIAALESKIEQMRTAVKETEEEIAALNRRRAALQRNSSPPQSNEAAIAQRHGEMAGQIENFTEHLAKLQKQADQAFLSVYDAPLAPVYDAPALLADPRDVLSGLRNKWLAESAMDDTLSHSAAYRDKLSQAENEKRALESQQQENRQRLKLRQEQIDNILHQIDATQKFLAAQKGELAQHKSALQKEKNRIFAHRPQPRPAIPAVETASVPDKNPQTDVNAAQERLAAAAVQAAAALPARTHTAHKYPVNGRVVLHFGQKDALGTKSRGLVLAGTKGDKVTLPHRGTVKFSGPFRNFNHLLIVEHEGGYHSLIAGLEQAETRIGKKLPAGAVIGHLAQEQAYYELRLNGEPIDPETVTAAF